MRAILLNGTSSAGKTSLARALQLRLDPPHLCFGVDAFLQALPPSMHGTEDGVRFATKQLDSGQSATTVDVGPEALQLFRGCHAAMAELVRRGVPVIADEVLLT